MAFVYFGHFCHHSGTVSTTWRAHFHVQDNWVDLGLFWGKSFALGRGDLHMAPGEGAIPFDAVFSDIDFPRKPVFMLETLVFDQRDGGPARMFQEAKRLAGLRG